MKTLLRLIGALVILLVIGVFAFFFYLDHIARRGIERGGSYALGVPTTLQVADVRPLAGSFELTGLAVANPPGFGQPHFLRIGDGRSSVRLKSLMEETVEIPSLTLTGLDVYLVGDEQKANYDAILANLKRFENPDKPHGAEAGGKRFIIRKIDVSDITVHIDMPVSGRPVKVDAPVGRIELTDVGSNSDTGVLMAELMDIIVKAVIAAIIEQGGLPTQVLVALQQGLDGLGSLADAGVSLAVTTVGGVIEGIGDIGAQVGEGVGQLGATLGEGVGEAAGEIGAGLAEGADKAIKGVGNLLGGKDKKKNDGDDQR